MTATQAGMALMIVEEEALIAMILRDELTDAGYHVLDLTDRRAEAVEVAPRAPLQSSTGLKALRRRRRTDRPGDG